MEKLLQNFTFEGFWKKVLRFVEKVGLDFVSRNRGAISWGMALLVRAFAGKGDRPSEYPRGQYLYFPTKSVNHRLNAGCLKLMTLSYIKKEQHDKFAQTDS